MGRRIEAIKRIIQSSPQEVMAGFLFHNVLNSRDHFWKTKYYKYTAYFELNHDNDAYMLDVLYLGQDTSFPLSTFMKSFPDYQSVLAITNQLLQWLENTYASSVSVPSMPRQRRAARPKRPRRPRRLPNANMLNNAANLRAIKQQAVKVAASQLLKAQQQKRQRDGQGNNNETKPNL